MQIYFMGEKVLSDLWVYQCGEEQCAPGHSFGPAVRRHFLLHYIRSGRGVYERCGREYALSAGQVFLIPPGDVTFYKADDLDPWSYVWVEFGGTYAAQVLERCGLSGKSPVADIKEERQLEEALMAVLTSCAKDRENLLSVSGRLYLFLSELLASCGQSDVHAQSKGGAQYVRQATEFIRLNYHRPITVTELCALVGVERSYLCRLFKQHTGLSPQAYVVEYKMKKAASLISDAGLTVAQAARSVGYEDQAAFSHLFKAQYGYPPRRLKEEHGGA